MMKLARHLSMLTLMAALAAVCQASSAPAPPVTAPAVDSAPATAKPVQDAAPKPTIEETIADIEQRGRYIADYDRVAWVASDLLMEMKPDKAKLGTFFAMRIEDRWYVFFGKLYPEADPPNFISAYTFSAPADHPDKPQPVTGEPPEPMKRNFQKIIAAALALDASSAFTKDLAIADRYNPYVYPEADGTYTVYYMPAQTDKDKIPLGGDFLIKISANGRRILEKRKLHNSILYSEYGKALQHKGDQMKAAVHSHVITPLPTETDVATILIHPELVQLMIVSQEWITGVDAKGKIKVLGATQELIGKGKDEKK